MRLTIFAKDQNQDIAHKIALMAEEEGFIIDDNNPEVVISIGGDGTFLRAIRKFIDKLDKIKIVAVNFGTLGFFAQYQKDELHQLFDDLKKDNFLVKQFKLLKGAAIYDDGNEEIIYSVNEIRVENPFHTLTCEVYINDELLEAFRGNGLIVSSSFGSSAYNKSLGGALINPEIPLLQLSEIAPIRNNVYHSLGSSLILQENTEITLKGQFGKSVVGYDDRNIDKMNLSSLKIKLSNKYINVIYRKDYSLVKMYRKSFVQ